MRFCRHLDLGLNLLAVVFSVVDTFTEMGSGRFGTRLNFQASIGSVFRDGDYGSEPLFSTSRVGPAVSQSVSRVAVRWLTIWSETCSHCIEMNVYGRNLSRLMKWGSHYKTAEDTLFGMHSA